MSNARMRSVTNYFIINLSMADIMNATLNVIPNFTYMLTGNWPFGKSLMSIICYEIILNVLKTSTEDTLHWGAISKSDQVLNQNTL